MPLFLHLQEGTFEECLIRNRPISSYDLEVPDGEFTIGRAPGSDLLLLADSVSKNHAVLKVEQGRFTIQDCGSSNGTLVNGKKITEPVELRHGDEILLRPYRFVVMSIKRPNVRSLKNQTKPTVISKQHRQIRVKTGVYEKLILNNSCAVTQDIKTKLHVGLDLSSILGKPYRLKRSQVAIWELYQKLPRKWLLMRKEISEDCHRICLVGPIGDIPISQEFSTRDECEDAIAEGFILHASIGHQHEEIINKILNVFIKQKLLIPVD